MPIRPGVARQPLASITRASGIAGAGPAPTAAIRPSWMTRWPRSYSVPAPAAVIRPAAVPLTVATAHPSITRLSIPQPHLLAGREARLAPDLPGPPGRGAGFARRERPLTGRIAR